VVGSIGSITDLNQANDAQSHLTKFDITSSLVPGQNTITIRAQNGPPEYGGCASPCSCEENPAGVVFGGSISISGLSITADPDHVWANGHQETKLTVREVDANGQGVPGRKILLRAVDSTGNPVAGVQGATVHIFPPGVTSPGEATTDNEGKAVFTATSTKVDTITFIAVDEQDSSLTDSATVDFQRHKIVVQVQGVNTWLKCNSINRECTGDTNFGDIDNSLFGQGFVPSDVLWYSYNGGTVDPLGQWIAKDYDEGATGNNLGASTNKLLDLLTTFGAANPNTDFYLIGHSQGGLLAFQAIGFVGSMKKAAPNSRVANIITLDAVLGGAPPSHVRTLVLKGWIFVSPFNHWGAPASSQMTELYQSATDNTRQGTTALLLCSNLGACPDFGSPVANVVAVRVNSQRSDFDRIAIANIGSSGSGLGPLGTSADDAVFYPPRLWLLHAWH
jgi:pimeloyl-ACP methyl ester carboxylesterase